MPKNFTYEIIENITTPNERIFQINYNKNIREIRDASIIIQFKKKFIVSKYILNLNDFFQLTKEETSFMKTT